MSFVKIWIHLVIGTKNRTCFLNKDMRDKVIIHILDSSKEKDIHIDSINGYHDHLHCLISAGSEQSIAKIVNLIKGESSYWINKNNLSKPKFEWAHEYFAVSVSESMVDTVRKYIQNQESHHKVKTFTEEYEEFMQKYGFRYMK